MIKNVFRRKILGLQSRFIIYRFLFSSPFAIIRTFQISSLTNRNHLHHVDFHCKVIMSKLSSDSRSSEGSMSISSSSSSSTRKFQQSQSEEKGRFLCCKEFANIKKNELIFTEIPLIAGKLMNVRYNNTN